MIQLSDDILVMVCGGVEENGCTGFVNVSPQQRGGKDKPGGNQDIFKFWSMD